MNVRQIPRSAIDGYLRLVRVSLDSVINRLPCDGTGIKPAAALAARDEARRLRDAANRAKTGRKTRIE